MERKTILIIDDAFDVRKLLSFHLGKKYDIIEARDGLEGFDIISQKHPDLVITDINMPRMGGIELYKKLSFGTGRPSFPVIIVTVREELGSLFKELDADGFITKPFDMQYVVREVDTIMAKRYGTQEEKSEKLLGGSKKILVVDNEPNSFNKIALAFINYGYLVYGARSGMGAIEKILADLPDLIVIKLGLPDISGDLVCVKLKQMPKTMDIPFILYASSGTNLDRAVVKRICDIIKADLLETNEPDEILSQARKLLTN